MKQRKRQSKRKCDGGGITKLGKQREQRKGKEEEKEEEKTGNVEGREK